MKDPLKPDQYVEAVQHIDFADLAAREIRHFCFDLDNTLVSQFSNDLVPEAKEALDQARAKGHIADLALISNVMVKGKKVRRLKTLAQELDIQKVFPCLFWTRKPGPAPFRWAIENLDAPASRICMVGDQIFSDVLGANRFGFYTILVKPLGGDHWTTRMTGRRSREKRLLRGYGLHPSRLD